MSRGSLQEARKYAQEIRSNLINLESQLNAAIADDLARARSFQAQVAPWVIECFGEEIAADKIERNWRFLEESLELVQALNCSREDAHALVDYVFGRGKGDPPQELGGVMVTLAALANSNNLDINESGWLELGRCWAKIEQIREKQATKPIASPLPMED